MKGEYGLEKTIINELFVLPVLSLSWWSKESNKIKMERTTKTFIGGAIIGSIFGGLLVWCVMGTLIINSLINF